MAKASGRRSGRRWVSTCLLALAAVVAGGPPTLATDPFLDTTVLGRHEGQELPAILSFDQILTGPAAFSHRRVLVESYDPWAAAIGRPADGVSILGGYTGIANTRSTGIRARKEFGETTAGAALRLDDAKSYRDAAGQRYNYGYRRDTEHLSLSHGKAETGKVSFLALHDGFGDARLPNYGTDSDYLDQTYVKVGGERSGLGGLFDKFRVGASYFGIQNENTNYLLRPLGAWQLDYRGDLHEAKIDALFSRNGEGGRTDLGTDLIWQRHSNTQYSRDRGIDVATAFRIPEVETLRAGLSLGHERKILDTTLQAAMRYDLIAKDAQEADKMPWDNSANAAQYNLTPRALYESYYGPGLDTNKVEHDFSARLRAERPFGDTLAFVDIKRLVRTADNGERFIANSGEVALREVGNPELDPEKHYKAEVGLTHTGGGYKDYGLASPAGAWRLSGSLAHDHVEHFITSDVARGQPGIRLADGAYVYRNVTAEISTVSADFQAMPADYLGLRLNVVGARGRNTTDDRPLYRVAPVEANAFVDLFGGTPDEGWNLGMRLRAVLPRSSVDDSTATGAGLDRGGKMDGFATVDLYAGLSYASAVTVRGGVENLFDKLYRDPIAGLPQTPVTSVLNAPERTFFLRALVAF